MTYYLSKVQEEEVTARMEYLYRVFHTHFTRCEDVDNFICLKAFPFRADDVCFVTGHNDVVRNFLLRGINAEVLVINSCFPVQFRRFRKNHEVYFCHVDYDGQARLRSGEEYATGFDILDSELFLLNSKESAVIEKIKDAYDFLGGTT